MGFAHWLRQGRRARRAVRGRAALDGADLFFFHHRATANAGDLAACPAAYVDLAPRQAAYDLSRLEEGLCERPVVLGGGLLGWADRLAGRYLAGARGPVFGWGVGTRLGDLYPPEWLARVRLWGVRDCNQPQIDGRKVFYVPCASCLSPLFDPRDDGGAVRARQPVVFYAHRAHTSKTDWARVRELPCRTNEDPLEAVVDFLRAAETVVTNSYHGVYWATLLGKRVVCLPYNEKFFGYRYPPVYARFENWTRAIDYARAHPEALEDARDRNRRFRDQVAEALAMP